MTRFRHLIWMIIATTGLMLSISHGYAQQPDVGDQPGLLPDDSVELDPEYRKQVVYYRPTRRREPSSLDRRALSLSGPAGRPRHPLRHRRRPRRLPVAGSSEHHAQGGVAGLDAAAGNDRAPALSAALHGGRTGQPARRARACISAPPSIASTAPTGRTRSAPRSPPAASGWSTLTSSISTIAFPSAPRSSFGRSRPCNRRD